MNSKPNENKPHTNPLISLVLPGNFKFFSDSLLRIFYFLTKATSVLSSQNATLNLFYKVRFPTTAVTIFKSLKCLVLAPQCLVFLFPIKKDVMEMVAFKFPTFSLHLCIHTSDFLQMDQSFVSPVRSLMPSKTEGKRRNPVFLSTELIHPLWVLAWLWLVDRFSSCE